MCNSTHTYYNKPDDQALAEVLSTPEMVERISPSVFYICAICGKSATDREFPLTFVSNNIIEVFGYDPAEILGNSLWCQEHIHPDDRHRALSALDHLFEQGKLSHEYRLRHSNGNYLWVQDDLVIMPDKHGNPIQILGTCRDITLRKRAIGELKKYETRFQAIFDNMVDVYYRTDMDGRLEFISPSCLMQLGYTQEELLDRLVTMLYADPTKREAFLEELRKKGVVNDFEIKFIRKDGSSGHASITSHFVRDQNDQPVAIEGIMRNISERHQAEKSLSTALQENRKLTLQMMLLQEEERRLLARELHDELAQLLTGIAVRAEYIGSQKVDSDITSKAKEITRDTDALFRLSRAILKRLRPAALDTLGLSAAVEELVGNWSEQNAVEYFLQIEGDLNQLDEAYNLAIYRVIQEGLSNACRHGKANSVKIVLRCLPPTASRQRSVRIEIEDNGRGMPVEKATSGGMGMIGMRERVQALGGVFLVTDGAGDGVRIEASIPVNEKEVPNHER